MDDGGATGDEPSIAGAGVATSSTTTSTEPGRPQESARRSSRRSLLSSSLVRSLDLAVSGVLIVAVAGVVTTLLSIIGTAIPADQATGSYGLEAPIVANGPSVAELWYQMLGSLGGWILVTVGVMLLIVQPVMEAVRRATPSRGLAVLAAVAAVAVAGVGFGVLAMLGNLPWMVVTGSVPNTSGSAFVFLVFGLVVYGIPVLIVAAVIVLLTFVIGRRRVRIVTTVLAGLVVVAVIVASTGAFRPPPAQAVAAAQRTEAIDGFTDALADVDGVADIDVDGHGATVTMSLDAGVGQVLAAASAAKRVGDDLQGIAIVVIQREPDPTSPAQQQDPPRGPWRVQLVPSDRSIDEIADQLQRLMLTERLQVDIDVDAADGTPRVTVFSMQALPAAVRELRELYPDGASYSVPDRFSMVDDPSELSPAMVDAILAVVEAYPGVEIEVTTQPKLWITDVTPEQGAAIVTILQNPALAGTSPSGYPLDYSISTSGPDQDLEGTFG
ncbi:hypothetical protein ASF83_16930 [Plantibacter sp. Leaf171]|uniref:hypothetical protein n=1 Tax=unclassified Plantibacter TaxID=2624265 RepID=UPI0006F74916|nr:MULTISPECIES: hypothetical protein [unclassified Plantibacter]KQM13436.1 hypothetical protein ASE44_16945 [Plantibacter sp. Leaf1]KQR56545.1 hypothetical protein ASF83_16930 [Plantibacter sp. Leaf171]